MDISVFDCCLHSIKVGIFPIGFQLISKEVPMQQMYLFRAGSSPVKSTVAFDYLIGTVLELLRIEVNMMKHRVCI